MSPSIEVKKGVFQGLPASPKNFNMSNDHVLKAVNEPEISAEYGFCLHSDVPNVSGRGFADDLGLIGSTAPNAAELTKIASTELSKVGYRLNYGKCVAINIKNGLLYEDAVELDDEVSIRSVKHGEVIKYLGVTFNDEIVFKPDIIMKNFNKDLQNLISTHMLYPHQKLAIINQYLWPCLIYALQSTPLNKIPTKFMQDMDKMIRATVKTIVGLPHDTPNAMLYASRKVRGLQVIKPSWETFIQHYNICLTLLKSNDRFVPYTKDLQAEMDQCLAQLQVDPVELSQKLEAAKKKKKVNVKPSNIIRDTLREKEYSEWCGHISRGTGVETFQENPAVNKQIIDKRGITNSEWVNVLKMSANLIPVRSLPGRSTSGPLCRHCGERETLAHVLGSCHRGDLLRNTRHNDIVKLILSDLREEKWTAIWEKSCMAVGGSNRRVDIWCYKEGSRKGYIIDPTVRMERSLNQAVEVNLEKQTIYNPCIPYFIEKYQGIEEVEVIGLLIGARGTISSFFEEFRQRFNLPKSLTSKIVISSIRGSCKILHHHLYNS